MSGVEDLSIIENGDKPEDQEEDEVHVCLTRLATYYSQRLPDASNEVRYTEAIRQIAEDIRTGDITRDQGRAMVRYALGRSDTTEWEQLQAAPAEETEDEEDTSSEMEAEAWSYFRRYPGCRKTKYAPTVRRNPFLVHSSGCACHSRPSYATAVQQHTNRFHTTA